MSHFNMLVFPAVLLPLSLKMQMSMVDTLALSFWMYLLFGISALPWGIAADRFGEKILLTIYHIGAGFCGFAAAFTVDNTLLFALSLSGIGLFSGIYHPVGLGWIARSVKRTSIGMAYNGMFGNLGLAAAPIFAGIVNYFFGIAVVYLIVGLVNLLGVFLVTGIKNNSERPAKTGKSNENEKSLQPFVILLIAMMLGGIVYRGTSVTLPAYFQLNNGQLFVQLENMFGGIGSENVAATLFTSLIYLLGMAGQFTGGKIGEKFDLRKGYLVFHLITIPAAAAMAITTDMPLIGFAMIHSFFLLGMQPIENTLVSRLAPPGLMSSAYGIKFILTFGVGALSVKVVEMVKVGYGFSSVYLALSIVSVILVFVITILIRRTTLQKEEFCN